MQSIASRLQVVEKLEDRTLLSGSTVSVALAQGVNNYTGMTNSWINGSSGQTTTNYSTTSTLFVNGKAGSEMDALLNWNLSSITSGSTVQSASIQFNIESVSGSGPYNLYALTTPWSPGGVTFNQATASTAWQVPGAHGANDAGTTVLGSFNPGANGLATITLNSAGIAVLQGWINNPSSNDGFILRSTSGQIVTSSDLDSVATNRPSLSLTYTVPPIYVNAGPNEAVTQTSVLTLSGTVQDNDPNATQPVSSTWSLVSGPGTVSFENPSSLTSDAVFSMPGTYVLQLSATDGVATGSSQVDILVEPPPPELSPLVNAGPNQTINLNQAATLAGQVSQAGTNPVTTQWSQLSGPGTAIFANSSALNTTVQFTGTGTYVLDLVATDGTLAANSTMTVTVNSAGTTSTQPPPVASAGSNQTVTLGTVVNLNGSVTYQTVSGATLSTVWQLAGGGPGTVSFGNASNPQTTATFSTTGIYYLRLLATYDGVTDQSYITITVNPVGGNTTSTFQQGVKSYTGGSSTYIDSSASTANYSTSSFNVVQSSSSDIDDMLIMFNLSGATFSGTVSAASLSLEPTSTTTSAISIYALSRPWTASQATYKNATSTTTWQTPGALGSTDYNSTLLGTLPSGSKAGVDAVTLTAAGISVIQGWINNPSTNYGFILRGASGTVFIDSDADSTTSARPILSITTTASGQPSQPPAVTNPVTSAQAAVNGSGGVSGYMSAVGLKLATLYFQYLQYQQSGSTSGFVPNLSQANIPADAVSGSNVAVFATSESTTVSQLQSSLQSLGMQVTLTSGNVIGGWLPISQIQNAALVHGLVSAVPTTIAKTDTKSLGVVAAPQNPSVVTAPIDPSQMRTAYGLNLLPDSGAGITIAIVDAFNDPTIIADAAAFNTAFGLPQFNSTGGPTLTVLGQTGTSTLPGNSPAGDDWTMEESLDVEWAHSIAPQANIILYEANSDTGLDLYDTEQAATANPKVSVISNSWGGSEFSGEQSLDPIFTTPTGHQGITFLAATGDSGAPSGYPAYSPNVVAVGGTTLDITASGTYESEAGWSGSAGGVSQFEPIPGYQIGKINGTSSTNRTNPDVSMDGDPNTGVFVIDSTVTGSTSTFLQVGGTSLATPMWAGLVALADQVRANVNETTLDGPSQTLPRLYQLPSSDFHDITTGNNGFPAGPGYDLVTGIGSPVANLLVPDLAGVSAAPGPSVTLSVQGNPISENGGQATITATLSAATTQAVTIQLQFSGTAVLGTQYSVSSTEILIPAGQTTGSITVSGINTNQNTGNQTIIATASSIQGGTAAGGSQSVTVIELENEAPQVTLTTSGGFGPGLSEFSENGGSVTITATLTQPLTTAITIALGFSGDAVLGTDYTASSQTINISAGSLSGSITLSGKGDTRVGASAAVYVSVESITPSGQATTVVGSGTTAAYIVYSQVGNPLPAISVSPSSPQVPDNGSVVVTISRSSQFGGSSAVDLEFNPNGTDTAILGTNYTVTNANGQLINSTNPTIFLDGLSTTITITGIVDALAAQPKLAFTIGLGETFDGVISSSAGSINGDVINSHPGVALSSSATAFSENGGSVTVTATLPYAVSTTTTIDLGYSGSAIANQDYTITNNGNVAGDSPVQIVIPAGQTTGSVTLTGASNPHTSGGESVIVSITSINGVVPTAPQVVNLSIANQAPPTISIEDLAVVENGTTGETANVVVQLSSATTSPVTVYYNTVDGTAVAGTDYTAENSHITIAAGATTGTIVIPLLVDGKATGALQFSVDLTNATGGTLGAKTSSTVTLVESDPLINIEDTSAVDISPTTAQVTLVLSQAMPANVNVSVNYQTTGGTAIPNINYIPESGVATFPGGTTTYTIDIPILGDQDQNQTENFLVQLSQPSMGTIVRSQGVVTLFNVQPGFAPPVGNGDTEPDQFDTASGATNFTADTSASGPFAPADPSGAVGPTSLVVFDSDLYQVFNKSTGTMLQSSTLDTFWTNAGIPLTSSDYAGQPHVTYDPATGRWYASALDESVPPGSVGPAVLQNNILLAVSKTSDPTQGWVGFEFATDPNGLGIRADFDSIGFNASSVVVTANMYNIATGNLVANGLLSVPKADLTAASPTVARATLLTNLSPAAANTYDPAVDYDAGGNEFMLAQSSSGPVIEVVTGGGGPSVPPPTPVTVANGTSTSFLTSAPIAAPQPAGAPPLTTGPGVQIVGGTGAQLDALSNNFTGSIVQQNGDLWAAQTVSTTDPTTGTTVDAIQWFEIDVTPTDANYEKIIQHGVIVDTSSNNVSYYYPSVSVDKTGDVAIGFSGSSLTQPISSYASYGTTTGGVTTFTSPILLKSGTGIYAGFSEANLASATISSSSATFDTTGTNNFATINVQLGAPAGPAGAVVDLGFSGTALANRDYDINTGTNSVVNAVGAPIELLIPAGQSSGSVVLTGLGNLTATGDQTIVASVTSINGAAPAAATSTTLTLVNTTPTTVATNGQPLITAENLTAVESLTTTAQVLVRLNEAVATPVTVDYSTANGTALAGTDYMSETSSVTFSPGQTVATINIPLINNSSAEGKTFTVDLTLPTGGRGTLLTTAPVVTLLTSYPTASPGPSVTLSGGGTFAEDGVVGAPIVATLSAPAPANGTLLIFSFTGTATFGTDYVASSESLYIPAGQISGSITLSGNDVAIGANSLSVTVGLQALYGANPIPPATPVTATLTPGGVASASITGQVTGNGNPLAGITVYLSTTPTVSLYGTNGDFNPSANYFTTTDANGNYSFTGLPAGTYTVRELIPENELLGSPAGNVQPVVLSQAQTTAINFSNSFSAVWGAYSATALDPSNPGVFWTFQGIDADQSGLDFNTWGVQATQLAVTNFTADFTQASGPQSSVNAEIFNIPVNLTTSSNLVSSNPVTVTATIPVQSTATTIYLGFSDGAPGTAEGNVNYFVTPGVNASFAEGAPVEIIIPAGQTSGSVFITGSGFSGLGPQGETSLTVDVDQINLAAPTITEPTLNLTVGGVEASLETGVGYETGLAATGNIQIPVRLNTTLPAGTSEVVSYTILNGINGLPAGTIAATDTAGGALPLNTLGSSGTITITGSNEGFITVPLTGNTIPQAENFIVELTNISNGTIIFGQQQEPELILNAEPPSAVTPTVTLTTSGATLNEAGTGNAITVTAKLANAATTDVVVYLTFQNNGGAVIGAQYTTTGEVIVIPQGQTTAAVTVTANDEGVGTFTVSAVQSTTFGAALTGTTAFTESIIPLSAFDGSPFLFGRVLDQNDNPMAGVYVYLGLFLPNNQYEGSDPAYIQGEPFVVTNAQGYYQFSNLSDGNPPGDNYTISELVPANYDEAFPRGNMYAVNITFSMTEGVIYKYNFLNDPGAETDTVIGGPEASDFFNELPGPADPAGAVGPNDIIEADNNHLIIYNKISGTVEQSMTIDQFWLSAWNEEALDGNGAGFLNVLMNAYEPQIVYDAASGRWYVTALDDSNPPYTPFSGTDPGFAGSGNGQAANDVLLAVSKDANPLDGWVEFVIPADEDLYGLNPDPLGLDPNVPDHRPLRADAVTIGFNGSLNSTALVLTANLYDDGSGETSTATQGSDPTSGDLVSTMILTIPKEDLLSAQTTNDPTVINNYTSVSEGAWTYGINPQAVVSEDANSPALVLAQNANQTNGDLVTNSLLLTTILASGTSFGISGTPVQIPLPVTYSTPIAAPQPNNAPPIAVSTETTVGASEDFGVPQNSALDPGLVHDGIDQRLSNVVEVNGDLWVAQTVLDSSNTSTTNSQGTDAIAWWEISLATNAVIQHGLISSKGTSDPNLFFYFPSIAVNKAGDVVVGFEGSDATTFISSFTAVGTTFNGTTTFTLPQLLASGTGVYTGLDSGVEPGPIGPVATPPAGGGASPLTPPPEVQRGGLEASLWGDYSATVVDPTNANAFWTFQQITDAQFSSDTETFSVQATRISVDAPAVTLSVSAPPAATTPLRLGILGDNLSAGDTSGTTPGWVSQLSSSGVVVVPTGAQQAVDSALAAGLSTQLPEESSLAPTLNYTTIMIGDNDALALVNGSETASQYISTIETNVEGAINNFLNNPSDTGDHLILGTVPDIFVTPEVVADVQSKGLSAATIATDQAAIQTANAAITSYAVEHGIPVIDLYAFYQNLLSKGTVTVGGTVFSGTASSTNSTPLWGTDGFTPATIAQGLIANMVIDAADFGYAAGLTPISDQTLVKNAGGVATAVTFPTYFNLAPYALASDSDAAIDTETVTATLSQASAHDVVVNLYFSGSQQNTDYFTTSQQIVIPAGHLSATVTLTGLGEPSALVMVGVSSLEGAVENTPQQVTVPLINPPSIVTLSASPDSFMPNSGAAQVTATLSAPSSKPTVVNLTYTEPGESAASQFASTPTFNQFAVTGGEIVQDANSGPNGDIWYSASTDSNHSEIGAINPATGAVVANFALPASNIPLDLTVGPDGNLWFLDQTGTSSFAVDKMSPTTGSILGSFAIAGASLFADNSIVSGPDGNLWFTDDGNNAIWQVTTSGTLTEFKIPTANSGAHGMVVAPDGNLYFAENNLGDIGKITTSGTITQIPIGANADPDEIIVGPGGNLWFTEFGPTSQGIGELTASGTYTNFPLPDLTFGGGTFAPGPTGLAEGPDGNVYFADSNTTTTTGGTVSPYLGIGEISASGTYSQLFLQSEPAGFYAPMMFLGPDNNIWFPMNGIGDVGQIDFSSGSGGGNGGGTGGSGGTANVPSDVFVSSVSIYIPAGSTTGSVMISGDGAVLASPETIDVTTLSVVGAYSQVPEQLTVTQNPSPPTGATIAGSVDESTTSNPPMAGVTVYLVAGSGSSTFNPNVDPFTTTNAAGTFAFTGLQAGTYTVYEVVPNGFNESAPASGSFPETLTTGQQVTGLVFTNTPAPANSNPAISLSLSNQTIPSNGGSATLTVQAANAPSAAASVVIRVSGIAPIADFSIVGPNGSPVSLTSSDTFTATIPVGQTSVTYTITANQDSSATLETVDFDIVSVTNATVTGTQEAEVGITNAKGGGTSLVVNTPTQISGTTPSGLAFSSTPTYDTAGDQPDFIYQAQLAGNGQLDFVVCNGGTDTISVILNPTSANPTTETYTVAGTPTGVVAADFTGSGVLDLAVATSNGVTILMGNGSGGFTVGGTWTAGTNPSAITAGDFNGDGKIDLAVANSGSNNISIFYGNGNGSFQNAVNIAVGSDPVDIKAANLTNTNVTDLVVANHGTGDNTVSVLINNGSGTFTQTKYTAGIQPNSIAIGDFTGSGVLDIAVANVGFNPSMSGMINTVSILMGNGSGSFTPVSIPVSGQPLPANVYAAGPAVDTITTGDVNGDGKLDLIVANNAIGSNEVTVLLNNGSGTFASPVALSVGTNPIPVSVVTGDYFGNGAIDIAAASDWGTGGVDGVTILQNQTIFNALAFRVYLSQPATSTVVVSYTTANGTGVAGTDYLPRSGKLIFAPGQVEETVYVPVLGTAGADKTVILQLSSATNAPILIGTGMGTINPASPAPVQATVTVSSGKLTINDPSQGDVIKINQLASGVEEVMVNNEVVGVYTGISGTINATTTNGQDQFVVDEEVTLGGVITDPAESNQADDDFVFAELANGASWSIQI